MYVQLERLTRLGVAFKTLLETGVSRGDLSTGWDCPCGCCCGTSRTVASIVDGNVYEYNESEYNCDPSTEGSMDSHPALVGTKREFIAALLKEASEQEAMASESTAEDSVAHASLREWIAYLQTM